MIYIFAFGLILSRKETDILVLGKPKDTDEDRRHNESVSDV